MHRGEDGSRGGGEENNWYLLIICNSSISDRFGNDGSWNWWLEMAPIFKAQCGKEEEEEEIKKKVEKRKRKKHEEEKEKEK